MNRIIKFRGRDLERGEQSSFYLKDYHTPHLENYYSENLEIVDD